MSSSVPPPPIIAAQDHAQQQQQFLKIPRIRLKRSNNNKGHNNNNAFSAEQVNQRNFDECDDVVGNGTGHLVNSHLIGKVNEQQQQQQGILHHHHHQQVIQVVKIMGDDAVGGNHGKNNSSQQWVIKPKKLPNPIKDSQAMQSIHKELMLNQKIGRSVLTHKTELQKAIEKLAVKSESDTLQQQQPLSSSSSSAIPPPQLVSGHQRSQPQGTEFQRILDARARLIEEQKCFVDGERKSDAVVESEFEKIHKRVTAAAKEASNKK